MSTKFVLVAMVIAVMTAQASSQFGWCNMSAMELWECKPAVTNPPAAPTKKCCSALAGADFRCLCSHRSRIASFGADPNLAKILPGKCNVPKSVPC